MHDIITLAANRAGLTTADAASGPAELLVVSWPPSARAELEISRREAGGELLAVVPDGDVALAEAAGDAGATDCIMLPLRTTDVAVRLGAAARRLAARNALNTSAELIDAMPLGVAVLTPDGRVTQVNQALARLAGAAPYELIGQCVGRDPLLGPVDSRVTAAFRQARDVGVTTAALQLRTVTGDRRPVVATVTAVRDTGRGVKAYLVTVREPTEPEQSLSALHRISAAEGSDSERHERMAIEASAVAGANSVAVIRTTPSGQIVAGATGDTVPVGSVIRGDLDTAADRAVTCHTGQQRVAVRLRFGGRTWGQLVAAVADHHRAEAHRRLDRFARLAALAVGDADAREVAPFPVDALTGLAGNTQFMEHLATAVANGTAHGRPVTVAMLDIDRLKRVNSTHGHIVGDDAVRAVGACLRGGMGQHDLVARTGGGEFAWIIEGLEPAVAMARVRAVRRAIATTTIRSVGAVTASFGIAQLGAGESGADSPSDVLQQAEVALQWAKMSGGNRCVEYSFEVAEEVFAHRAKMPAEAPSLRAMRALAWAVDARDPFTHQHSSRVADIAVRIASALGWTSGRAAQLREAGLLHDVGKIAVSDEVLFKSGPLTEEEFDLIKRHAIVGARIVEDVLSPEQATWVRSHHERLDGLGYPDGLRDDEIPEEARVLAVADSWDVMVSERHYKNARSHEDALAELRRCSGTQFWPPAVEALVAIVEVGALDAAPPSTDSIDRWLHGGAGAHVTIDAGSPSGRRAPASATGA